jgi:hypothetical protein
MKQLVGLMTIGAIIISVIAIIGIPFINQEHPIPSTDTKEVVKVLSDSLSLNTPLPSVPGKIPLYRTVHEDPANLIANYSKIFNVNGNVKNDGTSMMVLDQNGDTRALTVFIESGTMDYTDLSRWMKSDPQDAPELVPNEDTARIIAEKYLNDKGLLPKDAEFSNVGYATGESSNGTVYHKEAVVSYKHVVNNMTVIGDLLSIDVGGSGDILKIVKIWRDVLPNGEVSINPPNQAYSELQNAGKTGAITNVSLEYYSGDSWKDPKYLLPVYSFQGPDFPYYVSAAPSLGQSGVIQP